MDARPQRPRAVRVPDENAAPIAQGKQTLHQRHKSTGALSNMLGGVPGLKAAAKRTAFGDVSNTTRNIATAHDDSAVNGKQVHKDIANNQGLLRPAQRLLNTNAKGSINITSASINTAGPLTSNTTKATFAEVKQTQGLAIKHAPSKRATTVFKDTDAAELRVDSVQGQTQAYGGLTQAPKHELASATVAPVHHALEYHQLKNYIPVKHESSLRRVNNAEVPRREVISVPDTTNMTNDEAFELYMQSLEVEKAKILAAKAKALQAQPKELIPAPAAVKVDNIGIARQERELPAPPLLNEPEEYWEEEEEEEVYDEAGYTTAHSYRSRGDNTTGGVTTVLFPKVNHKVEQELAAAKQAVESARTEEEVEDDSWDTSMVAEYGDEIFAYMRELEVKMLPNAHYMDNQTEIQWSMRSVLMDWLIQVHHRFSLLPETLFLCVNYIDRFLSCKIVSLGKLQLVGATAIFVAAKYEEINCPSVNEIVYMVDGGYTVDEILKAERFMLSMLQFELGWPGPMSFLRRISKADDYDLETRTLAKYFLEVTIMDERFVGSPPSYIAAGAHCFARLMLKKGDWSAAHIYYSGYTWTQLRPLVSMIMECCENPAKHHAAVLEKYSDRRYKRASMYVQAEMGRGFTLPRQQPTQLSLPSLEDVAAHMPFETSNILPRPVQTKA